MAPPSRAAGGAIRRTIRRAARTRVIMDAPGGSPSPGGSLPGSRHGEVTVVTEGFRLDVTGPGLTAADVRRDVQNALRDEDLAGYRWLNPPT